VAFRGQDGRWSVYDLSVGVGSVLQKATASRSKTRAGRQRKVCSAEHESMRLSVSGSTGQRERMSNRGTGVPRRASKALCGMCKIESSTDSGQVSWAKSDNDQETE